MSEEELQAIEARAAAATPGPWRWAYAYQVRGTHWCLENDASAANGCTINHHLVTFGTEEYEYNDDGDATRVDQTPDFAFIAAARTDIPALLAELRRLKEAQRALLAALNDYGQHTAACELSKNRPCSCGLNAVVLASGDAQGRAG